MDLGLMGHAAIVQGASKGIGLGIARALAQEGCDVLLTARGEDALRHAAEAITRETGRRALWQAGDSADLAAADKLVARAECAFGRLDILVANSGGPPPGRFVDLSPEQWAAAANLILTAPCMLLKRALPLLEKSPAPRFFIVTSSSTREPVMGLTLSNTFRPGVTGLIKTLAQELAPQRVCCHSLAPGRIDTDRLGHVIENQAKQLGKTPDEVRKAMIASIPAGRLGEPADLGSVAAFLASPRAGYLTGLNILVDGGLIKTI
ncbi:SDR family oxidoreductase [Candidatus Poribacteria bacterium]|nr:SDR family oxidoreductase [Candidatus Poribacteria bacterium]